MALGKVGVKDRVFLLKEVVVDPPAAVDHRGKLLLLGHLAMEVRRIRRHRGGDKELRGVVHQSREQRKAVVLDVLGVEEDPQRTRHAALLPVALCGRGSRACLCVDDVVDGGEQLVHTLLVGGLRVLLGVDKEDPGQVVVGCFGLEELVFGVCAVDVLGDLFLQLFVLEVLIPDIL